ncbi:hypothetical protein ACILPN_13280 [Yersinia wautersii]|uniref:hypothetical protein n=1 Tax=Yersinia pseudotuberculosis TaxID=633 RepID=UPI00041D4A16|nr:hypothetical protein [Yersinia pseudotuberculosis]
MVAVKEKYLITEHDKHFIDILNRHAKKSPPYPLKLRWLIYYVHQIDKEIRGQNG